MRNPDDRRLTRRLSIEHTASPQRREPAPPRKIGFVPACAGAGATTLCLAAAEWRRAHMAGAAGTAHAAGTAGAANPKGSRSAALIHSAKGIAAAKPPAETITVLELAAAGDAPAGYPFDKLGCDRRFAGRGFASYYRLAKDGKPLGGAPLNLSGGVNWALRVPGETDTHPGTAGLVRLLHAVPGDLVLCDVSAALLAADRRTARDILSALDRILCVVDPLPSRLLASAPIVEEVRAAEARGIPVSWAVNKMNAGVNVRELTRFLALKAPVFLPALPPETVTAAEYACQTLAKEPLLAEGLARLPLFP
ncbi:MAG: hypothetical protein LBR00_04635 [Clostridiales Family XIII bacterium]|jgi:hypothetical protein|nr:hypothetical protein [Clostridiales Family XIII bacterium]